MIPDLVVITPGDGRDLRPWVTALAIAGLSGIVIREPYLTPQALLETLAHARSIPFVAVHSRTPGALGVPNCLHLPEGGLLEGTPSRPFGISCHSQEQVDRAMALGATYTILSPVWRPKSKPVDQRTPLGPDRFLAIAAGRPVLALGGMTPSRHRELRRRGAWGSAVLGDVFSEPSPKAAAARLRDYLDSGQKTNNSSS